ncbi:MAG: voltage-gated potassium channel [Mycobacterium sp.]|jgi:hypothetical protein|nr:voltage-gated potassium channel [Mycobacterium sp.]MDT5333010.1 voltage-gated potassium channel [Mycobacterium sp.]
MWTNSWGPAGIDWPLAFVALTFHGLYSVRVLLQPQGGVILLPFFRPLRLLSLAVVVTTLQQAVGHTIRGRVIIYTACVCGITLLGS